LLCLVIHRHGLVVLLRFVGRAALVILGLGGVGNLGLGVALNIRGGGDVLDNALAVLGAGLGIGGQLGAAGLHVLQDLGRAFAPQVHLPEPLGLLGFLGQALGGVVIAAVHGAAGGGQQRPGVALRIPAAGHLLENLLRRVFAGGVGHVKRLGFLGQRLGGVEL